MTIPASKKNTPQTLQNNATDLLVQCMYISLFISGNFSYSFEKQIII